MKLADEQKGEVVSFAAEMVRLPGASGKEGAVAACVLRKMNELGYDQVSVDEYGSVIGVLKGARPGPTLLFDGHTDAVPVRDEADWEHEPYGAELGDHRLWGRGSTDMKGALAAMVCAPAFLRREELCGTVIVSASVAEELMIGAALDHILDRYQADAVIIGEPTGMRLGCAEKGRASVEMISRGITAHSSRPDLGDNAVYRMMEAAERIRTLPRRSHPLLGDEVIELVEISSLPSPGNGSVPDTCRALWECRLLHGESKEGFMDRWKAALHGIGRVEVRIADYELESYTGKTLRMVDFLPGWLGAEIDRGFGSLVEAAVAECRRAVEYYAAPYGCNALVSASRRGIPTVIIGPGDIALAHKPNENILIDELLASAEVYGAVCRKMSALK